MVGKPSAATRRNLLRGSLLGAAALSTSSVLGACDSPSEDTGGKAQVRFWHWYTEQNDQWPVLIKEFEAAHPNVVIQMRLISYDAYLPALQGAVSAGDPPDIFAPHVLAIEYGKAGIATDLKADLGADFLKDFFASTNDEYADGGKQYALGWMAQTFGIFYDPDALSRAKVDIPETWEDLIDAGQKITKSGVMPCILANSPGTVDFVLPLITQATDNPTLVLDLDQQRNGARWDQPKVVEAMAKLDQLVKGGAFAPNANGITEVQAQNLFYTGKAAMLFLGSWVPQGLIQEAPKEFVARYKVMPTPAWAPGKRHWCANQAGAGFSVSAQSKNKGAALDFLKFLFEPARYATVMKDSASMPCTQTAGAQVVDPVLKQMTSWLLNGDGAPHILFGKGSSAAATNAVTALIGGQLTPARTAAKIQADVEQARR